MPSLFISDLDGTLLGRSGELSSRSKTGIVSLFERGVNFTVASARSHFSIRGILGDLPFELPIIEFNGAYVTDYHSGQHLLINALPPTLSALVLEVILRADLRPFVSSFNGQQDSLTYDLLINEGMRWYEERRRQAGDPRLRRVNDLHASLNDEVVSMTVMAQRRDQIVQLQDQLQAQFGQRLQMYCYENEYSKGTWWLTIHDVRASKHIAMAWLRDRYLPAARIIAFGDNLNDVEMLRHADRGIAVDNAIPELKSVADEVIGLCDDDAVIEYLMACLPG